jgi:hypothetical protein
VARLLAVALMLAGSAAAADLGVETSDAAPPEEVAHAIAAAVGPGSVRIVDGEGPLAELWLREELPTSEAGQVLEVAFPGIEEGTLVGVVALARPWQEYKALAVAPGVYTLRYALRPADGNHMGVSTYRDFLLLTPAAGDESADPMPPESLGAASMAATGQPHPATLALFPVWDDLTEPALLENDLGQPMLGVPLGTLTLGLTLEGQGEH